MISFKQFIRELDEPDEDHDSYEDAAREYVENCSQFPDIDTPLYRISGESSWEPVTHYLRTRHPRTRDSKSRGGSAKEQAYLFSQPEWSTYPKRSESIFCSTTKDFDVGSVDHGEHHERNLLYIYPFNGVKVAMLDDRDLNTMNILKATSWADEGKVTLTGLEWMIDRCFQEFPQYHSTSGAGIQNLLRIKELFLKGHSIFDPLANGNEEAAKIFADLPPLQRRELKVLATEFPQKAMPRDLGARLDKPAFLGLPGKTRECWFSGKYLSVPARDFPDFKAEVLKLQKRKPK